MDNVLGSSGLSPEQLYMMGMMGKLGALGGEDAAGYLIQNVFNPSAIDEANFNRNTQLAASYEDMYEMSGDKRYLDMAQATLAKIDPSLTLESMYGGEAQTVSGMEAPTFTEMVMQFPKYLGYRKRKDPLGYALGTMKPIGSLSDYWDQLEEDMMRKQYGDTLYEAYLASQSTE